MFDLGFGNSLAVREAFLNTYHGNPLYLAKDDLLKFDYPAHEGDPKIIEMTKKVIKRQIGLDYKHVFLTNGATGGVYIVLRAYALQGYEQCFTRKPPYYGRYPEIIKSAGLEHIYPGKRNKLIETVALIDTPSNPTAEITTPEIRPGLPVILDAVYLNNVYMTVKPAIMNHKILVGSYSKLLGINGIRLGWIATNDDLLAERIRPIVTSDYCGLSSASTLILNHCMYAFNWENFENSARMKLDYNREDWSKLEKYFGNTPVPGIGMFYYGPTDQKCKELLTKAGIYWTKGTMMGTDDDFGRINIGQSNDVIEKAVEAVLKADRIRK